MKAKRIGLLVAMMTILTAAPAMGVQSDALAAPDPDKADQLKERAEALYAQPKQWKKAARLLEQSADLRDASDPLAYECLVSAGRIQAVIGNYTTARETMEKAAAHAMARGAIVEAANAYIDAAHLSVTLQDSPRAQDLIERATLLTKSPLLTMEQRTVLMARLTV